MAVGSSRVVGTVTEWEGDDYAMLSWDVDLITFLAASDPEVGRRIAAPAGGRAVRCGRLVLCGTPIGHLGDASARLAEELAAADAIFAEDTRRARVLLNHLGVSGRPESYFAGNEARRAGRLARLLEAGATVALISDAGMPAVADPGLSAVRAALDAGARVSVVPGPSAVVAALAVSGLASDRFVFEGFLPRKGRERSARLEGLAAEARTVVPLLGHRPDRERPGRAGPGPGWRSSGDGGA